VNPGPQQPAPDPTFTEGRNLNGTSTKLAVATIVRVDGPDRRGVRTVIVRCPFKCRGRRTRHVHGVAGLPGWRVAHCPPVAGSCRSYWIDWPPDGGE
jgi:hypothetical protein